MYGNLNCINLIDFIRNKAVQEKFCIILSRKETAYFNLNKFFM